MQPIRRHSIVEQAVSRLRDGFRSGRWGDRLPGVVRLAGELGISKNTLREALHRLEAEGFLKDRGAGKPREIVIDQKGEPPRESLRVGIFVNSASQRDYSYSQLLLLNVKRAIETAGHTCFFADKSYDELGGNVTTAARFLGAAKADAWVAYGCPRDILEWFSRQPAPVCAVGGRSHELPIAATVSDAVMVMGSVFRNLMDQGHRRIVLFTPASWRQPTLGRVATGFHAVLAEYGVTPSAYNLPEWEETPDGLLGKLESLFRLTPPTAIILVEPVHCLATLDFLSKRGISVPRDISILCIQFDPMLSWYRPPLAHLEQPVIEHVHRVSRWLDSVSRGIPDTERKVFPSVFDPGGTIGPVGKSAGSRRVV